MGKYILLGMHQPNSSKNDFRLVHTADDYEQLLTIWKLIERFYSELTIDDHDNLNAASRRMVEEYPFLGSLYEIFHGSILFTVTIIGIFEALKVGSEHLDEFT